MSAPGRSQALTPQPFKGEGSAVSAPGRSQALTPQPFKGEGVSDGAPERTVCSARRRALGLAAAWLGGMAGPAAAQHGGGHGHAGHGGPADQAAAAASGATSAGTKRRRASLGTGFAWAPDGRIWAVMPGRQGQLLLQHRRSDAGSSWSEPMVLDLGGDTVSADGENHPKIAFGPGGTAVISYTQPLARPYSGRIRLLRSDDGGRRFGAPITVHHDQQEITHRFESLAFDGRGALHVVWIDKRDLEAAKAAGRPYAGAAIYHAVSHDGGVGFAPERKLADHSCECCRIALGRSADGRLAAMWRHVWPVNLRDHAFAWLDGTGTGSPAGPGQPQRATHDGWVVAGCPHHGPGLAPAADGGWHAVWFGQRDGRQAARLGRLDRDGRAQGAVRELPDEGAEHACIASAGDRVAVVWRSHDGAAWRWRAWLSVDDGRSFTPRELGRSEGDADYPRLATEGARLMALWRTSEQGLRHVEL